MQIDDQSKARQAFWALILKYSVSWIANTAWLVKFKICIIVRLHDDSKFAYISCNYISFLQNFGNFKSFLRKKAKRLAKRVSKEADVIMKVSLFEILMNCLLLCFIYNCFIKNWLLYMIKNSKQCQRIFIDYPFLLY